MTEPLVTELHPLPQEPPAKAGRWLFAAVGAVANVMLVIMVAAILFQVVARYAFARPPFWTEELARYGMIWSGTLGAALAFWRSADPRFVEPGVVFGTRWERTTTLLALAPAVIFAGVLLYQSLFGPGQNLARGFMARNLSRTSEALEINLAWIAASFPIMALLILIAVMLQLTAILRRRRPGGLS